MRQARVPRGVSGSVRQLCAFLVILAGFAACGPEGIGFLKSAPPTVSLDAVPDSGVDIHHIGNGVCAFAVTGSSTGLRGDRHSVVVLAHEPADGESGWSVNGPAVLAKDGVWRSVVWIGHREAMPAVGDHIEIVAVVAERGVVRVGHRLEGKQSIGPLAESGPLTLVVQSISN